MPVVDLKIAQHSLHLDPNTKFKKQKRWSNPPRKRVFVKQQVAKLLEAGVIQEVTYLEWISNLVIVSKEDSDKLWTCIGLTNVNDACLNDFYPTSPVDHLVDSTVGYAKLSFLDSYSGYHQIQMDPKDEEKTAFITDGETYCYIWI